jgi:hypothetical protein
MGTEKGFSMTPFFLEYIDNQGHGMDILTVDTNTIDNETNE